MFPKPALLLLPLDQLLVTAIVHWKPDWVNTTNQRWFSGVPMGVSLLFALLLLTFLALYTDLPKRSPWGFSLIAMGALSNGLTLLIYGKVIDYIPLPTTYANAADLLIVLGCGVVLFSVLRKSSSSLPS